MERRITDLQHAIDSKAAERRSQSPDTPAPQPAPTQRGIAPPVAVSRTDVGTGGAVGRNKRVAGIVVGAVGLGAVAAGATFGGLAKQAGDDLSRINDMMLHFDAAKERAGQTDQVLETVLLTVGGAAVVCGVTLYAIGWREQRASEKRAGARIASSGAF